MTTTTCVEWPEVDREPASVGRWTGASQQLDTQRRFLAGAEQGDTESMTRLGWLLRARAGPVIPLWMDGPIPSASDEPDLTVSWKSRRIATG